MITTLLAIIPVIAVFLAVAIAVVIGGILVSPQHQQRQRKDQRHNDQQPSMRGIVRARAW